MARQGATRRALSLSGMTVRLCATRMQWPETGKYDRNEHTKTTRRRDKETRRKGREGKGREGKRMKCTSSSSAAQPSPSARTPLKSSRGKIGSPEPERAPPQCLRPSDAPRECGTQATRECERAATYAQRMRNARHPARSQEVVIVDLAQQGDHRVRTYGRRMSARVRSCDRANSCAARQRPWRARV